MGKFLSSLFIVIIITASVGLGAFLASFLPGVNHDLLGPHRFLAYMQSYLIFVIPNILFFGVIVFSVVTITRNISVGFITVILLLFIHYAIFSSVFLISSVLNNNEGQRSSSSDCNCHPGRGGSPVVGS
jgi:ABC-2 type transport system permease protein